jgi:hypothetical protein
MTPQKSDFGEMLHPQRPADPVNEPPAIQNAETWPDGRVFSARWTVFRNLGIRDRRP